VINGIFNTNKLRLSLLVCVEVLNINKTFLVAFSYCLSESNKSINFVWQCLKEKYFIFSKVTPPRKIIDN
jgi:hypothetical protein